MLSMTMRDDLVQSASRAGSAYRPSDAKVCAMGLLRIATVAAIGIALLPSDKEQQQHLYERASASAEWAVTFCDRNAAMCAKGAELWTQFVAKAQFGAQL